MTDKIEQLERLARLKDSGALTDEEFQAQKGLLLGAEAPAGRVDHVAPDAVGVEGSWNLFQPVGSADEARALGDLSAVATAFLILSMLLDSGGTIIGASRNAVDPDGVPYADYLATVLSANAIIALVMLAVGVVFWKGRARWAGLALLTISILMAGGTVLVVLDSDRGLVSWAHNLLSGVLAGGAVYFSIQAVRGAFGARRFGRVSDAAANFATPSSARPRHLSEAVSIGFEDRRPIRKVTLWVGAAVMLSVVAAGVIFAAQNQSDHPPAVPLIAASTESSPEPAPEKALQTPSRPIEPAGRLPNIRQGVDYAVARGEILEAGFEPYPINLGSSCPGDVCNVYPEVIECSGMAISPESAAYAPCIFRFRRASDGLEILVQSSGEYMPSYGQDVAFHEMGVLTQQDRRTIAEIEQSYASW